MIRNQNTKIINLVRQFGYRGWKNTYSVLEGIEDNEYKDKNVEYIEYPYD